MDSVNFRAQVREACVCTLAGILYERVSYFGGDRWNEDRRNAECLVANNEYLVDQIAAFFAFRLLQELKWERVGTDGIKASQMPAFDLSTFKRLAGHEVFRLLFNASRGT